MREKESGLVEEFKAPWITLIAARTAKEVEKPETPMVREASITTIPRNNFLLT
jgi:hypothetical protein